MANIKEWLAKLLEIDGAVGACLVDSASGMMLGAEGGHGVINLELAAAGNTEVVRAKRKAMNALSLKRASGFPAVAGDAGGVECLLQPLTGICLSKLVAEPLS